MPTADDILTELGRLSRLLTAEEKKNAQLRSAFETCRHYRYSLPGTVGADLMQHEFETLLDGHHQQSTEPTK